jgi:hypothetical protein
VEKVFVIFVLVIGAANMLADGPILDFFNWIWIGFWALFCVFLIIYYHWDHKEFPGYKRKKSKES